MTGPQGLRAKRLLVVEDEALVAADLEIRLTSMGYEVCGTADNADDAVRLTRELLPDLVLMDIHLYGDGDGITAADSIRLSPGTPVVFATAHADHATVLRAGLSEPYGYVIKPFEKRDLRVGIEMALYRHQAEGRLRKMERWVTSTLSSLGDGVIATDVDGRVQFVNELACNLTGWSALEAFGRPLAEVLRLIDRRRQPVSVPELCERATQYGVNLFLDEHDLVRRDEQLQAVDESIAPIRTAAGDTEGFVVVLRDATGRKQAEAKRLGIELRLQEELRIEGVGYLAAGIAHDFNNLLTVIAGNISLAREAVARTSPTQGLLAAAQSPAAIGARDLCQTLLTYAGRSPRVLGPVDLSAIAEDSLMLVRRRAPVAMTFRSKLPRDLPALTADPAQMQQVILNLLHNALEALPAEGGDLRLETGLHQVDQALLDQCLPGSQCQPGPCLFVAVADTGKGMPAEVLSRIFDPFFTTKPSGRGLGLAAVQGIIRQQGGAIRVVSEVGRGSEFSVLLPVRG